MRAVVIIMVCGLAFTLVGCEPTEASAAECVGPTCSGDNAPTKCHEKPKCHKTCHPAPHHAHKHGRCHHRFVKVRPCFPLLRRLLCRRLVCH